MIYSLTKSFESALAEPHYRSNDPEQVVQATADYSTIILDQVLKRDSLLFDDARTIDWAIAIGY